jgi:ubiquinone/menaquinone biosynthesis C-methylase UbiE
VYRKETNVTTSSENTFENKLQFWNERAGLGTVAGSDDFILKQLEMDAIRARIPQGARVLDAGCGNGDTLLRLGRECAATGMGIDFADGMVTLAKAACANAGLSHALQFRQGTLPDLDDGIGTFDVVMTQRSLINLANADAQRAAVRRLMQAVAPGGHYLMVESFRQGLERTNAWRTLLELEPMQAPWHNVFLDENAVPSWVEGLGTLVERVSLSSTYHLLSRVLYAKLAKDRNEPLRYDSDINMLALKLPVVGDFGPVRLFVFRRDG